MEQLKLNPNDFRVTYAGTFQYGDGTTEDYIFVEVYPGYTCDLFIEWDDQGPYALPCMCSDGIGYIYSDDMTNTTSAIVSDEDIWAVEDFATDYYLNHPDKFDSAE